MSYRGRGPSEAFEFSFAHCPCRDRLFQRLAAFQMRSDILKAKPKVSEAPELSLEAEGPLAGHDDSFYFCDADAHSSSAGP